MDGDTQEPGAFRALGTIAPGQWASIARRHDLGQIVSVEALGGANGNTVAIRTDRGRWVLRGAVPPVGVATLRRERFFARALQGRSRLAVPWPYVIEASSEPLGWPYALMPHLPGDTPPIMEAGGSQAVGAALGRAAAALTFGTGRDQISNALAGRVLLGWFAVCGDADVDL